MKAFETKWLLPLLVCCIISGTSSAQCLTNSFSKTDLVTDVTFDSFGELIGGKTINAFSINVTSLVDPCPWDLYLDDALASVTLVGLPYSSQGVALSTANINVRAVNACNTADNEYPFPTGPRLIPAITSTFNPSFSVAGPHYVIGSVVLAEGVIIDNNGACSGVPEINDNGSATTDPTTHSFRFDLQIIPGVSPIIQPGLYRLDLTINIADDLSGVVIPPSLTYSLNIDILPILQLQMTSSSQIDFNFNEIKDYNAGITQYGATKLNINSSVNWDLMAIGTSTLNENGAGATPYWDNSVFYSTVGSPNIPLDALELYQNPINPTAGQSGAGLDYSVTLTNPPSQDNNIEVATGPGVLLVGVAPYVLGKTIAGNWGASGAGNMVGPGSYLAQNAAWNRADFSYSISYRLTPGLPARFNYSQFALMPKDAQPGAYTMQVRYILVEDF